MLKILYILIFSFGLSNQSNIQLATTDSLPTNIPFIKNMLWGNNGIIRNSFMNPNSRVKELRIRKNMLQLHQKIALFTLGAMLYQSNVGYKMTEQTDGYLKYKDLHMNLGYLTFGTYMTAASLSIFSPPGMKYTKKISSIKIHRYLALIHFAGMAIQPSLGYYTSVAGIECQNGIPGRCQDRESLLDLHKTVGTITVSSYILAFLTTLIR